ncbi:stage II sporulation protein M [Polycladomyces subterraneus]|uniref:Stage II sporulation protein M n=1 Tax=Polycladomyces subterraneus TaxID=1016997 RepID=A0ABT8IMW2_9BACL|nr:stage II sporulation protein M [Polycladomyces subterraneus]MDN4594120.1 stage II sporulation protein M [Polycladomyces subterraneus]
MKRNRKRFGIWVQQHIQSLLSLYIFVTVLFVMGVVFGAIIVNTLSDSQKQDLLHYMGYFFQGLNQNSIAEPRIAFQHAMGDHLKTLGLMWILGLSIVGLPLILILVFLKGLGIGFTVGFLVNQLSWKGLWFAMVAVLPHNLLVVPVMIFVAVSGLQFSLLLVKNRLIQRRGTIYPQFLSYSVSVTAMAIVLVIASFFEAYVSPWLMRSAVPPLEHAQAWLGVLINL